MSEIMDSETKKYTEKIILTGVKVLLPNPQLRISLISVCWKYTNIYAYIPNYQDHGDPLPLSRGQG